MQLHDGYGYFLRYPVEQLRRDLRVCSILKGASQVMRMIVGRYRLRDMLR